MWTSLRWRRVLIALAFSAAVSLLLVPALLPAIAQDAACPDAPAPRLIVGEQGRVTPGDPNNVRDAAARSGNLIGEIPGGAIFDVLEGPVCADGFNWWRVTYVDLTGWTVEGAGTDYWVEPIAPVTPTPTPPPTATPLPPEPAHVFELPRPIVNVLASGVQARVINDDPDSETISLSVRATPGVDGELITRLEAGDIVTILDGVEEVDSLIWREIELADGRQGWAAEGFWNADRDRYERALLAACPYTENRLAFDIDRYLFTADFDGANACALDRLYLPVFHTFYPFYMYVPNQMFWSPDGTQFAYVDQPDGRAETQELYILSADGLTRRQITEDSYVFWVDWSPDGQRLLFSRSLQGLGFPNIWTMRADGTGLSALTSGNHTKVWGAWLADSETVVYVENIGEPKNQMSPTPQEYIFYTVNVRQGGLREIYRAELDLVDNVVSPDRSQLVLSGWVVEPVAGTNVYEYTDFQTALIDLQTGDSLPMPELTDYRIFDWLPDGSAQFYWRGETVTLFPVNGDAPTTVELERAVDPPGFGYVRRVRWISDHEEVWLGSGSHPDGYDDELVVVDYRDGSVTTLIGPVGRR